MSRGWDHASPFLTLLGGGALLLWALCVSLGTGLGYDEPITGLFDGGISSLWRIFKAVFLGILGAAAVKVGIDAWENQ
jgi:hypothetical protein